MTIEHNRVDNFNPHAWKQAPSVQLAEERAEAERELQRDIEFEKKSIRKALHSMDVKEEKKMLVQMKETDARDHAASTRSVPELGPRAIKNVETREAESKAPSPSPTPTRSHGPTR